MVQTTVYVKICTTNVLNSESKSRKDMVYHFVRTIKTSCRRSGLSQKVKCQTEIDDVDQALFHTGLAYL